MNITELQLLALVRASLWLKPAEKEIFQHEEVDWQKIGQLALQQTVGILAFEGALSLPEAFLPPKAWRQKALSFIETNRRTHILVDGCVAESVTSLRNAGIDAVLLKGQAYARAYPRTEMRQCGDIDLYVGEANYRPAYEAVKRFGWECEDEFKPWAKHYGCHLRKVGIELHRTAAILPSRSSDRKFRWWSMDQLSKSKNTVTICGQEIPVPTPTFDVVFVFLHLYHHFLNGGIGLRQVCDWTMLLHLHAKDINPSELEHKLKDFKLTKAWKAFTPIAVEHLGLPKSECPLYSPEYRLQAERVFRLILKEGNFGRANRKSTVRPKGYLHGKAYSFRLNSVRLMSKLSIDPNTISRTYVSYVIRGVSRVIKDIMKRD